MLDFLFGFGQFVCIAGLLYGGVLAIGSARDSKPSRPLQLEIGGDAPPSAPGVQLRIVPEEYVGILKVIPLSVERDVGAPEMPRLTAASRRQPKATRRRPGAKQADARPSRSARAALVMDRHRASKPRPRPPCM